MGDQSLGRLIRKRRDALGFTQARLGELVGRSASTIRNWERDKSKPSGRSDAVALAAVLGLEEAEVLERAGFGVPDAVDHQTVEQAYASLAPEQDTDGEPPAASKQAEPGPATSGAEPAATSTGAKSVAEDQAGDGDTERAETRKPSPYDDRPWRRTTPPPPPRRLVAVPPQERADQDIPERGEVSDRESVPEREVARAAPPTVLEVAPPREASYVEDPEERQRYRMRHLGTAALILLLIVVFIWSFDRAVDALGSAWDEFVGMLAL